MRCSKLLYIIYTQLSPLSQEFAAFLNPSASSHPHHTKKLPQILSNPQELKSFIASSRRARRPQRPVPPKCGGEHRSPAHLKSSKSLFLFRGIQIDFLTPCLCHTQSQQRKICVSLFQLSCRIFCCTRHKPIHFPIIRHTTSPLHRQGPSSPTVQTHRSLVGTVALDGPLSQIVYLK